MNSPVEPPAVGLSLLPGACLAISRGRQAWPGSRRPVAVLQGAALFLQPPWRWRDGSYCGGARLSVEKVGGSGVTALLNCCSLTRSDVQLLMILAINRKKAQNSAGIVVWKGIIKHVCAPRAHICACLSQRQSHPYLLQPNHLNEEFIATKQLGIFFLQLPGIQWNW